jgi:hypothetical protein
MGREKIKLFLKDGRIRTIPKVLHIPDLAIKLVSISWMIDASVHILFEKETYKMVQGAMVLMRGVQNGNLYKLLGNTISNGCNNYFVP